MTVVQTRIRNKQCIVCGCIDKRTRSGMRYCAKCDAMMMRNRPCTDKKKVRQ